MERYIPSTSRAKYYENKNLISTGILSYELRTKTGHSTVRKEKRDVSIQEEKLTKPQSMALAMRKKSTALPPFS